MQKFSFLLCCLCPTFLWAQENRSDSIYFYQQTQQQLALSQDNATFLLSNPQSYTGTFALYHQHQEGNLRPVQQAQRSQVLGFKTEGITKLGRVKVNGHFSYQKSFQDSLAWSAKGIEELEKPYYFGSQKAGAFQRTRYETGGILSYSILAQRLYIATKVNFLYHTATRDVDPRPEVNTYQLKLWPELVYQHRAHRMGLQALWGYSNERNNLIYKTIDFRNSLAYPDRINYFMEGYGKIRRFQGNNKILTNSKYQGLGLNYSLNRQDESLHVSAQYSYEDEGTYQDRAESLNRFYYGHYYTDLFKAKAQWMRKGLKYRQQLQVQYDYQNSNDVNTLLQAINYRYVHTNLKMQYHLQWLNFKQASPEVFVYSRYSDVSRKDGASDIQVENQRLHVGLGGNLYLKLKKENTLSLQLSLAAQQALKQNLSIPNTQNNIFVQEIIYPDYSYNSSDFWSIGTQVEYIDKSIFKDFNAGIKLQADYMGMLKAQKIDTPKPIILGDRLINLNLSFNLYF